MYRGEKPIETRMAATFALRNVAEHAVDFWLSAEDLPDPDNRVTLDRDGNVLLAYTPNNTEPMEQLYRRVKRHLSHLGMHPDHLISRSTYMKSDVPVAGCRTRPHRAVRDVRHAHRAQASWFLTSALNMTRAPRSSTPTAGRTRSTTSMWSTRSFFPSIGAVNPALTAMAIALRVGDHLLERLG